jgi:flavin-binding protein dodecin
MAEEGVMSVAKTIELTATSPDGFEAAIREAVAKASETLRNIEGVWVKEQKVLVRDGQVTGFRVHLEVTFVLD